MAGPGRGDGFGGAWKTQVGVSIMAVWAQIFEEHLLASTILSSSPH
jgi:hypothetical protein